MARPLPVKARGLRRLYWVHDVRSAVTRHPNMVSLYTAIQIPASTVLLEEGVERGEEIGHGSGSVADAMSGGQVADVLIGLNGAFG